MKVAVVSHALPPSWSGQAVILHRLLRGLSPESYCLVSHQVSRTGGEPHATGALPARSYEVPQVAVPGRIPRRLHPWTARVAIIAGIVLRGVRIALILRREGCTAVVGCTGDLVDVPAAYVAARLARVPFYAYMFDYYSEQWITPVRRAAARRLERVVVRGARCVIVPNEVLGDAIRQRYGAEIAIVRNAAEAMHDVASTSDGQVGGGPARIVYTGAVYEANQHAFRNLVDALARPDSSRAEAHLYTAQSDEELAARGIAGRFVRHDHAPQVEVAAIQRAADILFLPLGLDSPYPELIRTSAPAKLGEYLSAGRPILVHAPPDSFVATYFREHGCGLLVDTDDPTALAGAIARLVADRELGSRLVERALKRARTDFSVDAARRAFEAAVGLLEAA